MSRIIQFRCFYRGVMYPVKKMQFDTDGSFSVSIIEMDLDYLGFRDVSPDSEHIEGIMQSTGLKDKNGKEIFEGDIVYLGFIAGKGQFPYDGEIKERFAPIIWSDFRASWTLKFNEFSNNDLFRYTTHGNIAEVVGNIFEHKHLLK